MATNLLWTYPTLPTPYPLRGHVRHIHRRLVSSQTFSWLTSASGDPVPEFNVIGGTADQKDLLAHLVDAEFMRVRGDISVAAAAVERQLEVWTKEFEETSRLRKRAKF